MSSPEEKPPDPAAELVKSDGVGGSGSDTVSGTAEKKSSSTWFALRNPVFCRLWLATLLSGTFVSSQDVTATWLMDYLGASPYLLSLMATAASAPFFLFTLPAGAIADIVNRRTVIVSAVLWQAAWSVILAIGAWTDAINPFAVLACVFALGIGLAFGAPVWGAVVPDIVGKDELPSAITLGGVNEPLGNCGSCARRFVATAAWRTASHFIECDGVSGCRSCHHAVEAAAGGVNQAARELHGIVRQLAAIRSQFAAHEDDPFSECALFGCDLGYPSALARDRAQELCLFGFSTGPYLRVRGRWFIDRSGVRPAVPQATGLDERYHFDLDGNNDRRSLLNVGHPPSAYFDGIDSICWRGLGAGGIRALGGWTARNARLGAWTDERVPDNAWARRHGAWSNSSGDGVANVGVDLTFAAATVVAVVVLALGHRFSINFATEARVDEAPLDHAHDLAVVPDHDDGPITITINYLIATEDREQFGILMQEVQAACRRNGAFQCQLEENLDQPSLFRLEYHVSTWAEHLRMNMRMTVEETKVYQKAWDLHAGDSEPIVRHFRSTQRFLSLPGFGFSGRTFVNTSRMPKPRLVAATSEA